MCDRLWVVDTGLADILGEPTVYSDPAILIYDLNTDKLLRKYTFKEDVVKQDSFFANIVSTNYLLLMNCIYVLQTICKLTVGQTNRFAVIIWPAKKSYFY